MLLVKPVMQSPRRYAVLPSKLLQSHFAGAVAGNECGDQFRSLIRGLVTIFFHPPILPAHTRLHRPHPLYPLRSISSYTVALDALGVPGQQFFRLRVTLNEQDTNGGGLSDWEEALYVQKTGVLPSARDSNGDGMNDLQEFQLGLQPSKKDNPMVGLVVFTPLEKIAHQFCTPSRRKNGRETDEAPQVTLRWTERVPAHRSWA